MDVNFNIDSDAEEVHGVIDGAITFSAIKTETGYKFRNFDRLDDEDLQKKLKTICITLLSLE